MKKSDLKVVDNTVDKPVDSPAEKLIFVKLNTLTKVQRIRLPPDALIVADKLCGSCHGTGRWAGKGCHCLQAMVTPYKSQVRNEPGEPIRRRIIPQIGKPDELEKPLEVKGPDAK